MSEILHLNTTVGDKVFLIDGSTAEVTGSELEKLDEARKVGRSHNGWLPHTHYPTYSTNPNTGKRYSNRKTSETTYGDHELMDYAIKALGWLFYTGGNLN